MMPKEESKKQLITRATQYGVDPVIFCFFSSGTLRPSKPVFVRKALVVYWWGIRVLSKHQRAAKDSASY